MRVVVKNLFTNNFRFKTLPYQGTHVSLTCKDNVIQCKAYKPAFPTCVAFRLHTLMLITYFIK